MIQQIGGLEMRKAVVCTVLAAGLFASALPMARAATSPYRPDAMISKKQDTGYKGDDVYNTTGRDQKKHDRMEEGTHSFFHIALENDGNDDSITVEGCDGNHQFTLKYTSGLHPPRSPVARGPNSRIDGSQDITNDVEKGTAEFDTTSGIQYLTANIYAKTSTQGAKFSCKITAASVADTSVQDVVLAKVVTI